MFSSLKGLFSPTNKDLRKRIWFTLICLAVFAVGTNIVVPGAKEISKNLGFLELLNLMSGGSLKTFSIFALGVMPYITASIITQLLQMDVIPYFKELKEQGAVGKQKINKINRYLGIGFAFIQGYIFSYAFLANAGTIEIIKTTLILTAGTAFLLWLGDAITKKGIGNGISLIIMAGIINTLPSSFIIAYQELVLGSSFTTWTGLILFGIFVLLYLFIVVGIIYIQTADRRIPIQYSTRTSSAYGGNKSFIPIKLNSAGVIPVIFASALIGIPSLFAQVSNKESVVNFVDKYITYTSYSGFLIYMLLIFVFGYFYTLLQLNPDDMAKNLDKNRSYIPGITPGDKTSEYLKYVISRLTIVGTIYLMIISALPIIFSGATKLPAQVSLGGTGLLIVVGVALETYKQLESSIISRSYTGRRKGRLKS
ncbi:MAG: preprotein translocase subunit SecY [Bacilli bacterium]|nr:preprotein translocase subunit SecY [Bacilli bacterium]MDD3895836.1 preprotein translocase subunit SecY [Bacilli bacterium]MDD4407660.1 preprotein translocase subunit SecY [Bacilli bacterium]